MGLAGLMVCQEGVSEACELGHGAQRPQGVCPEMWSGLDASRERSLTPKVQVCVSQGPGCPWLAQEGHPLLHPHPMDAGPLPSLAFRAQSQQMQLHSGPWLSSASPKDGPPDMLGGSLGLLDPRPMAMCTS